ncbi:uncharacterized protein PGTG_15345 [Puccinia graminis f. sp. tritici CRL 75-36-700-3]|uniref:Uncharacterized protein n=1 Tax=Puccinia graminis f. sp. tritici (strain CRL 75-36-700-3 / race SCCL) TaxID=418459 RepID=E3KYV7_PUCGT|nr:uncharacterized protein PGTG_15345 [Puccinia graminis f. sp. tritici CRL 75-36-700-3]EFP89503.1 hypothetical protein PGTG_15345 [Puccinia graminis f. sp. tritici CRL 75-36-700-3]
MKPTTKNRRTTTSTRLASSPHPSSSSSASSSSSSLPRTPKPHNTLLDSILSSPRQSHTTKKTETQITPNKLNRALNNLLNQPRGHPSHKQTAMNQLIQTLSTLRSKHHIHDHLEQPYSKRIKIQAAADGSASLVLPSMQPTLDPSHYYYQHLHYPQPTTIEYGRVIMKKDALINKLGLEAAQRAIRKARSQRKPYRPSANHPPSSSPPSSPQTSCWRTGRIGKWLESADDDSEEEGDRRTNLPRGRDLMGSLSKLAKEESSTSVQPSSSSTDQAANDPQSLFWSPIKGKQKVSGIPATKRAPHSASIAAPIDSQQILERIGRMSALEMGIRWPLDRPSTPPNQQSSFFHIDELNAARGHRHPADRLAPFSQLSFGSQSGTALQTSMLKPGCNLSQAFLVRAASPTILLSAPAPADENRSPLVLAPQPHLSPSLPARPHQNDFSPCSPLRHDLLKLIDQHQGSARLDSPNPITAFSSSQSTAAHEHRWLADLDTNSLANLNFDNPFSSPTPDPPLEDFLGYV